jgi:SAM-dependent methyltransferase
MLEDQKSPRFSFADYEHIIRGPEYEALRKRGREMAPLFADCTRVLDIASGQGFLLDSLAEIGISAFGVDTEPELVKQCQERGHTVAQDDALHFLATTSDRFDGVNCAHFIEHLEFEAVIDLVEGIRRVLLPGGLLILRWPNPRSVVMQHLSFWRDPTHVRYYDGQLIAAVLTYYGFELAQTHYATVEPEIHSIPNMLPSQPPPASSPTANEPQFSRSRRLVRGVYHLTQRLPLAKKAAAAFKRRFLFSLIHAPRLQLLMELPLEAQIYAHRGRG